MAEYWRAIRSLRDRYPDLATWRIQAYVLSSSDRSVCQTDTQFLSSVCDYFPHCPSEISDSDLESTVARLKMFCAMLRHCYVSDIEIVGLSFDDRRLFVGTPTGATILVSSGPVSPGASTCVLSGDPDDWLSLSRWVNLKQARASDSRHEPPQPIEFDVCMSSVLRALGATPLETGFWLPPASWAHDELQEYVHSNWRLFSGPARPCRRM